MEIASGIFRPGPEQRFSRLAEWLPTGPGRRLFLVAALFFTASGLSSTFVPIYLYTIGGGSLLSLIFLLAPVFAVLGFTPLLFQRWRGSAYPRLLPAGVLAMGAFQLTLSVLNIPALLGLAWGFGLALFWPPFNSYLYGLTDSRKKIQEITVIAVALPGFAGVVGPLLGAAIASSRVLGLGLPAVFALAGALYLSAFFAALGLPRNLPGGSLGPVRPLSPFRVRGFGRFGVAYGLLGFTDTGWIMYPLYLFALAGSILYLGVVVSVISLFGAFVSPITARWADRQRTTWVPALLGYVVFVAWLIALGVVNQLWEAAVLGLAGAAGGLQVALLRGYTSLFPKEALPSAATGRELCLGVGRLGNLAFTFALIGSLPLTLSVFHEYFLLLGALSLAIPLYILATRLEVPSSGRTPSHPSRVGAWARRIPIPGLR